MFEIDGNNFPVSKVQFLHILTSSKVYRADYIIFKLHKQEQQRADKEHDAETVQRVLNRAIVFAGEGSE